MNRKPSSSSMDPSEKGLIGGTYQILYHGSASCKSEAIAGIKDAQAFLTGIHIQPTPISLELAIDGLYLNDKKNKELQRKIPTVNIYYVHVDASSGTLCVIENDGKMKHLLCHAFKLVKPKEMHDLVIILGEILKIFSSDLDLPANKKLFVKHCEKTCKDKKEIPMFLSNKGEKKQKYDTFWINELVVKRNAAEFTAEDGLKLLQGSTMHNEKPVIMTVYDRRITAINKISNDVCSEIACIEFISIKLLVNDTIIVVVGTAINQPGHLIVFGVKNPKVEAPNPSLRRTLFTVWQDAVAEQKKKLEAMETDAFLGKIQTTICCALLGQTPYPKEYKPNKATDKTDMIKVAFSMFKKDERKWVSVSVGTEGIVVYDSLKGEEIQRFSQKGIASHTALTGPLNEALYGYCIKDPRNGTYFALTLMLDEKLSGQLTAVMDSSAKPAQGLSGADDPFKAVGGRVPAPKDLFVRQIHRRHLRAVKPIGSGQFGQVYLAMQTVEKGSSSIEIKRAVKTLKGEVTEAARDEFVHEAEIMLKINHKNCVELIGVACQQRPWLMALEFLEYGDLLLVVKGCAQYKIEMTPAEQLYISWQPACGLAYLASRRLIHMDIAARNCLVGANNLVKISDFGMTKKLAGVNLEYVPTMSIKVPVKWCAIEILEERRFSEASDVWACGVLLWEILSRGMQPYEGILQANMAKYLKQGNRLIAPPLGYLPLYKIAQKCWNEKRSERPKFEAMAADIKKLLSSLMSLNPDLEIRDLANTVARKKDPTKEKSAAITKASMISMDDEPSSKADASPEAPAPARKPPSTPLPVTPAPAASSAGFFNVPGNKVEAKGGELSAADVGKRCVVSGYDCEGKLVFYGSGTTNKEVTCGVVLDRKIGRNNGTVRGVTYFKCEDGYGVMCNPEKITLLTDSVMLVSDPYAAPNLETKKSEDDGPDLTTKVTLDDDVPLSPPPPDDDEEEEPGDESKWVMGTDNDDLQEPDLQPPSSPGKGGEAALTKAMADMNMEDDDDGMKRRLSTVAPKRVLSAEDNAKLRKKMEADVAAKLTNDSSLSSSMRLAMQSQQDQAKKNWGTTSPGEVDPNILRSTFFKGGSDAEKPTGSAWFDEQKVEEKPAVQDDSGFGFN